MRDIYTTVTAACGHVPRSVFVKATKRLKLSPGSYRIAQEVLIDGFRQVTVARHVGVSRQRVHTICRDVLIEIQKLTANRSSE